MEIEEIPAFGNGLALGTLLDRLFLGENEPVSCSIDNARNRRNSRDLSVMIRRFELPV